MMDLIWLVLIISAGVGVSHSVSRWIRRKPVENLRLWDLPISDTKWKRLAALAIALNVSQKTLIARALEYYLEKMTE